MQPRIEVYHVHWLAIGLSTLAFLLETSADMTPGVTPERGVGVVVARMRTAHHVPAIVLTGGDGSGIAAEKSKKWIVAADLADEG